MKSKTLLFILLIQLHFTYSQSIEGTIISNHDNTPLEGVSVYFDGTTIGTTTNTKGVFKLEIEKQISANLVISYIGYKQLIFQDTDVIPKIFILEEETTSLDEVVITTDDWSRTKKMNYPEAEPSRYQNKVS